MIRLFLADCDGTLTDGIYQMTEGGKISKNFFTRDFHGLWMLNEAGVEVGIITAASDDVIMHQCNRGARYAKLLTGSKNKHADVEQHYNIGVRFAWNEIAFIGDDIFDIKLMNAVGLISCPSDADPSILDLVADGSPNNLNSEGAGFVSSFAGGKGCVREFAEYVLDKMDKMDK